jgi:PAS domain S-box-containing protein
VNLLPSATEFPENASARLSLYGQEYKTDTYRETSWKLVRPIFVRGAGAGFLELNYVKEPERNGRPVFRESEQKLFRSVAERLGRIVERKEADERLRESEEKYSNVVESARDGVVIIQDHIFKYANAAMAEISGYPVEALRGMLFLDLFHPGPARPDPRKIRTQALGRADPPRRLRDKGQEAGRHVDERGDFLYRHPFRRETGRHGIRPGHHGQGQGGGRDPETRLP